MTPAIPFANKRWFIPARITQAQSQSLGEYDPILRQLLVNRGYTTPAEARRYLEAQPPQDSDPFKMTGMGAAVERIFRAVRQAEKIAVYGDYDVDGVTATALLTTALRSMGGNVIPYIPAATTQYGSPLAPQIR